MSFVWSLILYTEFNKNYLYRFLSCIYILDFLGLCSLFSILFYSYPLNRLRDTPYAKGLGLLALQVRRATIVARGIYSRSASGDYSSPSVEVTVYLH